MEMLKGGLQKEASYGVLRLVTADISAECRPATTCFWSLVIQRDSMNIFAAVSYQRWWRDPYWGLPVKR